MKALLSIVLFCQLLALSDFSIKSSTQTDLENTKYQNYLAAANNLSTFSYFTVVRVKDLNTGIVKEICTKGNFLAGAVHRELHVDYDGKGLQKVYDFIASKKDRYFEFKSKEALDNISFFDYDSELLFKIRSKYNFTTAIDYINKCKAFSIRLPDKEMKAFAHILFNKGYLTGENNCWGGALEYVDRPKAVQ